MSFRSFRPRSSSRDPYESLGHYSPAYCSVCKESVYEMKASYTKLPGVNYLSPSTTTTLPHRLKG